MNKRGITKAGAIIIFTLIIIIAFLVFFLAMTISDDNETTEFTDDINLEIITSEENTFWDKENSLVSVEVKREGEDDVCGLNLIFLISGGNILHFEKSAPEIDSTKIYYVNLSDYFGDLESIKVAPVSCKGDVWEVTAEIELGDIAQGSIQELIDSGAISGDDLENPNGGSGTESSSGGGGSSGGGTSNNPQEGNTEGNSDNGSVEEVETEDPVMVTGLLAHWKLDGDATDSSGKGKHGTITGVTAAADRLGNANGAYYFGGNDEKDMITVPTVEIPEDSPFSFSIWVKPDTDIAGYSGIIGTGDATNSIKPQSGSKIGIGIDGEYIVASLIPLTRDGSTWTHIVATRDSLGNGKIYINGEDQSNPLAISTANFEFAIIGKDYGESRYFKGAMDEIRIYSRALILEEAQSLYAGEEVYTIEGQETEEVTPTFINPVAPATPTCGDASCNGDEICSSCEADCGMCSTSYPSTGCPGTTCYYVSASGSDSNDGLSEGNSWKTISKVNSMTFSPGDYVLFKRGEEWREQLTVSSSGSAAGQITYGAYGAGVKPIFNGADVISGWTVFDGDVWKASVTTEPGFVFFDGAYGKEEPLMTNLNQKYDWHWNSGVLYIYSEEDPNTEHTSPGIEAGSRSYGILLENKDYITLEGIEIIYPNNFAVHPRNENDHLVIQDLRISNTGTTAIRIYGGEDILVDSSYIFHTSRNSADTEEGSVGGCVGPTGSNGVEISNNICKYSHGPRAQGISLIAGGNKNIHIHHNEVGYTDDDGIKTYGGENILIEYNDVHDVGFPTGSFGTAMNFYNGNILTNYTARYNTIHDNAGAGFSWGICRCKEKD